MVMFTYLSGCLESIYKEIRSSVRSLNAINKLDTLMHISHGLPSKPSSIGVTRVAKHLVDDVELSLLMVSQHWSECRLDSY